MGDSSTSTAPPPSKPKVTDEELEAAVAHLCQTREPPAVKTAQVADVDFINIEQQTVKRRLDKLEEAGRVKSIQISRGRIWWIPDESEDEYAEADESPIYWAGIDPAEIPTEMVKEHPEFPDPDRWEKLNERANHMVQEAVIPTVAGLALILLQEVDLPYITLGQDIQTVSALFFVGGFFFMILGVLVGMASKLGERLESVDYEPIIQRSREAIEAGLGRREAD